MNETLYLDLPHEEIQKRNILLKHDREAGLEAEIFEEKLKPILRNDKRIRAVTVCFTDLEGKFHLLDYNKDFFLNSLDNLTFDGSSINGFTELHKSDLRLSPDWKSFRWLPASIFGDGKVLIFSHILNQDRSNFECDMRSRLSVLLDTLRLEQGKRILTAPEIEGFLLKGIDAEQSFTENDPYELATNTGYFSSLPNDTLRIFMDEFAKIQLILGFENEKDHPEVAPSQFELNFRYTDAVASADNIMLYKLVAKQIAKTMGYTASFLPKPFAEINGNGMHTNISITQNDENIFFDNSDPDNLSPVARQFAAGILHYAKELCLIMNSSVNSYRRLDPNFEAPNEIKISDKDRGSMVRIPVCNKKSARIEIRTVAPDANPYLVLFALTKAGLFGIEKKMSVPREGEILPSNIYMAIEHYDSSDYLKSILHESVHKKYRDLKQNVAKRSPREMGTFVKTSEVIFHHEVRNQSLWSQF